MENRLDQEEDELFPALLVPDTVSIGYCNTSIHVGVLAFPDFSHERKSCGALSKSVTAYD